MTITVIHTSPEKIVNIHNMGLFDDCLFFSGSEYAMGGVAAVYELDLEEDKIISDYDLYDEDVITDIVNYVGVDRDEAESLLDGSQNNCEHGWWIQARQGECAKKMGYDACQSEDEQGVVYIVPMFGKEGDLREVS